MKTDKAVYSLQEVKALQEIELEKSFWKSAVFRRMEIWEAIAENINSHEKHSIEHQFWCRVMDLFHEKYPTL